MPLANIRLSDGSLQNSTINVTSYELVRPRPGTTRLFLLSLLQPSALVFAERAREEHLGSCLASGLSRGSRLFSFKVPLGTSALGSFLFKEEHVIRPIGAFFLWPFIAMGLDRSTLASRPFHSESNQATFLTWLHDLHLLYGQVLAIVGLSRRAPCEAAAKLAG